MRALVFDIVSIGLMLASLVFMYRAVEFMAQKDYVAGLVTVGIGVLVIRVGVEVGRFAILARRDER